jgi:hypothetical protein
MFPRTTFLALAAITALASPSRALLQAQSLDGWAGRANLVDSRLTIHVGPQWIDVEEESEVLVVPDWTGSEMRWIVEGTFEVPKGTAITGCMLWNGDTLLMGKLRGKQEANAIFDSLVPPRNPAWARDPLLVEQLTETTYGLKLFPFEPNGTRRFRLRYLVPRPAGSSEISVRPLMSRNLDGTIPASFRLRLRGSEPNMRIVQNGAVWPVDLPSSEKVELSSYADVRLRWTTGGSSESGNALRGSQASGGWSGDYVMYSGKVPDSILSKVNLKSETVVLWSWIQPRNFLSSCYDYYGGNGACVTNLGYQAISQASQIRSATRALVEAGNRVGMVADEGLDDSLKVFALGDSASSSWRSMDVWLGGMDASYLRARIPLASGSGGVPTSQPASRLRSRFQVDLRRVATLYSADSGIVRHLLVVTAGVSASSATPEEVDASLLPRGVSVASTNFGSRPWSYDYNNRTYLYGDYPSAVWPGIDLDGLVRARRGTSAIESRDGLRLPRIRTRLPVRLSIGSSSGRIGRNMVLQKGPQGGFVANLNAHGTNLSRSLTWAIYGDSGETLASWDHTPAWTELAGDSVFPRLWSKSEIPMSPIFEDFDLGPIFGVVDFHHSLLATPSDTVGALRQAALRDSGVPFLTWAEIFPRQGFGEEGELGNGGDGDGDGNTNTAVGTRTGTHCLKLSWLSARRTLRIQLAGLSAQGIEIRDLRGRLLATYTASQLSGLASLEWTAPAGLGRGMILVSVRTASGLQTASVMMN